MDKEKCKHCIHGDGYGGCVTKMEAPLDTFKCDDNEEFEGEKFYERAIAEFKRAEKERCKRNIDAFIKSVTSFANDGNCHGVRCEDCPIKIYQRERKCTIFCDKLSVERRREIITSEVL